MLSCVVDENNKKIEICLSKFFNIFLKFTQPANPSERRFSLAVVTVEIFAPMTNGPIDFVGAPYEFWVGADVPVGSSVGQIRTNFDYTSNGEVMYDLLHSYSEGVPFAVEEKSGIVTVIRDIAFFERVRYDFEAVATHVCHIYKF